MELSAKQSDVVKDFYSISSVSINETDTTVNVHQGTEVICQVHPTQWQILGFINADVTEKNIGGDVLPTNFVFIQTLNCFQMS